MKHKKCDIIHINQSSEQLIRALKIDELNCSCIERRK